MEVDDEKEIREDDPVLVQDGEDLRELAEYLLELLIIPFGVLARGVGFEGDVVARRGIGLHVEIVRAIAAIERVVTQRVRPVHVEPVGLRAG